MPQDREAEIVSVTLGLFFIALALMSLTTSLGFYGLLVFLGAAMIVAGVLPWRYQQFKSVFQRG